MAHAHDNFYGRQPISNWPDILQIIPNIWQIHPDAKYKKILNVYCLANQISSSKLILIRGGGSNRWHQYPLPLSGHGKRLIRF